ncbi:MAG TPA: FecR domain-containing protein [Gemmatimonadaceae bacterium]|nr:FecR domain-containing protein [Gemmatimonadaceae bacterium]
MSDEIDWVRLTDCLAGRASLAERAALERWAREAPERERALAEARTLWERASTLREPVGEVAEGDVRRAWAALSARIDAETREPVPAGAGVSAAPVGGRRAFRAGGLFAPPRRGSRVTRTVLRAAAVIVAALGGAIAIRGLARRPIPAAAPVVREIATGRGQRAEVRLADGSRVVLGVDSRLRWPTTFGSRQRDVELEGEALFTVAHDAARPFVVRSANAVIRDIGTEFGVHAYAGESRVRVAVRSGAVAIAPARDTSTHRALLHAGDLATLAADGALRVEHDADVERELAFADGRLEFADTPMSEVARTLERWYDVRVIVDDALATAKISAPFERDTELSTVLRVLGASLGASVTRQGRTVHFEVRR